MVDIKAVVAEGLAAAQKAANDYIAKYGEPFYCGFGWVEVTVTRTNTKEAKELLAAGFRKDYKPRTLVYWNPSGHPTQSMDVKETAAYAMAKVLREAGLDARACSRPD